MIKLDNLTVAFGGLIALDRIEADFTQPVCGIIGPNGAGKTTTMNVMSGFVSARGGACLVDGTDLLGMRPHLRTRWGLRRSFQKEQIADDLSVLDNLRALSDNLGGAAAARRQDIHSAIEFVGIGDILSKTGAQLNTFERRLTDIARCVIGAPKAIMLDEPAGGLTGEETETLGSLIMGIYDLTGAQVLVIDHDVDLISRICAQTLVLDFGKRIAMGPTRSVLEQPVVKAAYLGLENPGDTAEMANA